MTVHINHIAIIVMGGLGLLAWLGKRFPGSVGRVTHMWFGPVPHNGESAKHYYLLWAKVSFCGFVAVALLALVLAFLANRFGWDKNVYFMAPFSLAAWLLPVTALVRTLECLFKGVRHRDQTLTITDGGDKDSQQSHAEPTSEDALRAAAEEADA